MDVVIVDQYGRRMRRTIGFLPTFERERDTPNGDVLVTACGFMIPLESDDDDEESEAGTPAET